MKKLYQVEYEDRMWFVLAKSKKEVKKLIYDEVSTLYSPMDLEEVYISNCGKAVEISTSLNVDRYDGPIG